MLHDLHVDFTPRSGADSCSESYLRILVSNSRENAEGVGRRLGSLRAAQ